MTRSEYLSAAAEIINGERQADYGSPSDSFDVIAGYWSVYLSRTAEKEVVLAGSDVANLLGLMKIGRLTTSRFQLGKDDTFIDLLGYFAISAEISERDRLDIGL